MRPGLLASGLLLCALAPAYGQERIISYDSEVRILADGTLDVTERITVHAEGGRIRRGIYRDFPTRYSDRYGNRVNVGLDILGVERNGRPEPWFTERLSNGIRINTGTDDLLLVPARYTYTFRFRTTRQLGFFASHDELYWNAIGTGWLLPIMAGSVAVRLPAAVPVDSMAAEAYTGYEGEAGQAYTAETPSPGVARYRLTQGLAPQQGFTLVLAFPKGVVDEPTAAARTWWMLSDNAGVLIALAGLIILLLYCAREWRRVGRDPERGVIIARYQPPAGHTPASLRFVQRMGYDTRCFSADVLALAVAGHVRIRRDAKRFTERWVLESSAPATHPTMHAAATHPATHAAATHPATHAAATHPATHAAAASADELRAPGPPGAAPSGSRTGLLVAPARTQLTLLHQLFTGGRQVLELKNTNAQIVQAAQRAHQQALDGELHGRYFQRNRRSVVIGATIALMAAAAAFAAAAAAHGGGMPLVIAVAALMGLTLVVFGHLVRAPTTEGRALLDEIAGLKLYLGVAEREELARVPAPHETPRLDAERYEALLPYAVALEVEDAWTTKFTAAVGAAAAAQAASNMAWYSGSGPIRDMGSFTRAIGSSLNSQISSSSRPPGSSSGAGGGGSSGGGGGGGGGGGR
jgi:uncharacterized membrane protein YgcG